MLKKHLDKKPRQAWGICHFARKPAPLLAAFTAYRSGVQSKSPLVALYAFSLCPDTNSLVAETSTSLSASPPQEAALKSLLSLLFPRGDNPSILHLSSGHTFSPACPPRSTSKPFYRFTLALRPIPSPPRAAGEALPPPRSHSPSPPGAWRALPSLPAGEHTR